MKTITKLFLAAVMLVAGAGGMNATKKLVLSRESGGFWDEDDDDF